MEGYLVEDEKKITSTRFTQMKAQGKKIAMLTAYDYTMAQIVDAAGVDSILIGDSASNVMAGNDTTLPITIDQMIYHARSVARGAKRAFIICDMPFGTYQVSREEGVKNAIRMMQETGVDCLKLEGGVEIIDAVRGIINAGIPVCGHLGLTPQSVFKFGGFGLRAKEEAEANKLISDAKLLEEAGCCAVVLEKIPAALANKVTAQLHIPTIGIGAGNGCDGQVLVGQDMLGMNRGFKPKFLRHFADLYTAITDGVGDYVRAVKDGSFPNENEQY
ncbi:MAG: 3-methyl-2-oxobutanoate hydroxymethyltransferase [Bacteroidaceae bacterium]|nr:3-methyl-2-oxobutanoate hydroxymethyltransferase [Bacteroidaceae bacterium]